MQATLLGCGSMDVPSAQYMVLPTLSKNKVGYRLHKTCKLCIKFEAMTVIHA